MQLLLDITFHNINFLKYTYIHIIVTVLLCIIDFKDPTKCGTEGLGKK